MTQSFLKLKSVELDDMSKLLTGSCMSLLLSDCNYSSTACALLSSCLSLFYFYFFYFLCFQTRTHLIYPCPSLPFCLPLCVSLFSSWLSAEVFWCCFALGILSLLTSSREKQTGGTVVRLLGAVCCAFAVCAVESSIMCVMCYSKRKPDIVILCPSGCRETGQVNIQSLLQSVASVGF